MIKGLGHSPSNVGLKDFHLFIPSKRRQMRALHVPFYAVNMPLKMHGFALGDKDPRAAILIYN